MTSQPDFRRSVLADRRPSLATGEGGPHDPGMEARVDRLEEDVREIRGDLKQILAIMGRLPTRDQLFGTTATVFAIAFAVVALIAAIFAFRQDQFIALSERASQPAPAAQPIIIQMPALPSLPVPLPGVPGLPSTPPPVPAPPKP